MAGCKTVFVLVAMINLVTSAVPGISVSDLEHRITVLESNMADYKEEAQKQASELAIAKKDRQRLEQTILQLQTQIQSQEDHYSRVVDGLISKIALLAENSAKLTRDNNQLPLTCNSSLAEIGTVKGRVNELETRANIQARDLIDLQEKVNETEARANNQRKDLNDLKMKATSTAGELAYLSSTSSKLQVEVNNLKILEYQNGAEISNLASKIDLASMELIVFARNTISVSDFMQMKKNLTSHVSELSISLAQAAKQREDLGTTVSRLQKVVDAIPTFQQHTAAFTSYLWNSTTIHKDSNVVFTEILANIGNNYNSSTGIFTSPYSGVYVFHLHAMGQQAKQFYLQLYSGYSDIGVYSGVGSAGFDHASNTNVLYLAAGDEVVVKSRMDSYLFNSFTSFSGYLLYTW